MITQQDILKTTGWKLLPDNSLTNKLYNDGYYPYSITVGNNTYTLTITSSKNKYRDVLPDSIKLLEKNINKQIGYDSDLVNKRPISPIYLKKQYTTKKTRIKSAKANKNLR